MAAGARVLWAIGEIARLEARTATPPFPGFPVNKDLLDRLTVLRRISHNGLESFSNRKAELEKIKEQVENVE